MCPSRHRRERGDDRNVLVLSPHFDDAPLSLGESLRHGVLAPHRVRVRVVFGRTNWTEWLHPTPGRAALVSLWRRLEETAAGLAFGYRWTAAGWEEVILRAGDLDPATFLDERADLRHEPLVPEVADWLRAVISAPNLSGRTRRRGAGTVAPPELVLAPAGLGGHRDHLIVARAAARLLEDGDVPVGFYEDRPYRAYLDPAAVAEHMVGLAPGLAPVTVSGPAQRSTQRLVRACYPSQMSRYFTEAMAHDRESRAGETLWFRSGTVPEWLRV